MSAMRRARALPWQRWSLCALWAAYAMAFAWVGGGRVLHDARAFPPTAPGRYATTDRYLAPLQIAHPSAVLQQTMAIFPPPDGPLLVVGSSHAMVSVVYYSLGYLGWPRPMWSLVCGEPATSMPLTQLPPEGTPLAGVIFAYQPPPADLQAISIPLGPFLAVAPATERSWRSYCRP